MLDHEQRGNWDESTARADSFLARTVGLEALPSGTSARRASTCVPRAAATSPPHWPMPKLLLEHVREGTGGEQLPSSSRRRRARVRRRRTATTEADALLAELFREGTTLPFLPRAGDASCPTSSSSSAAEERVHCGHRGCSVLAVARRRDRGREGRVCRSGGELRADRCARHRGVDAAACGRGARSGGPTARGRRAARTRARVLPRSARDAVRPPRRDAARGAQAASGGAGRAPRSRSRADTSGGAAPCAASACAACGSRRTARARPRSDPCTASASAWGGRGNPIASRSRSSISEAIACAPSRFGTPGNHARNMSRDAWATRAFVSR